MKAITDPYELRLTPRGLHEIPDVSGMRVACNQGSVWITLDHDPRDIVLEAGGVFSGAEHRRALIYAFTAAELVVGRVAPKACPKARGRAASSGSPTCFPTRLQLPSRT